MKKRQIAAALAFAVTLGIIPVPVSADEEVTFVYGTTGYGVEMGDEGLNPHHNYSGWSCLRYGVGETLFKYNDSMEVEPWLATDYEFLDACTVEIILREGVQFSSGRVMDAEAVKECLEDLIAVHDRAPSDLGIDSIEADGMTVTIHTEEPCPAIINYLSDPYGAIIDMEYGIRGDSAGTQNVAGTGPYIATEVTETQITLVKNENYWGGEVTVDNVIVKTITDAGTLQNALLTGEIDGTYGLGYDSYVLFEGNPDYTIHSVATSRCYFGQFNFASELMQDEAVRKAICMGIDKETFCSVLLNGRGVSAVGAFPSSFSFGNDALETVSYDPEGAVAVLEEAGWTDTDGDGYVDKDGKKLTVRWLTYPGRIELPVLAEAAQATLKAIGIDVEVNSTADHLSVLETGNFDLYVSALTTAPTGDPQYFFTSVCTTTAPKNRGAYANEEVDALVAQLSTAFDTEERAELAVQIQQILLDDYAYFFVEHLNMGIVTSNKFTGIAAHTCDYYEITSELALSD